MHTLWIFLLKKRSFTALLILTLLLGGTFSLFAIPKESTPEVVIPIGFVTTTLRGASADDTEKLVTNKLEDELGNLENLDKLNSISREGVSLVTVQFLASANLDKSMQDLKEAVDRAKVELPREADQPVVTRLNFSDQPILIVSVSGDYSPAGLSSLGEELKNELKKVKGISKVSVSGTRDRETEVVVRRALLSQYGLSVNDVIGAISSANASLPIGDIIVSDVNYAVRFDGGIDDPAQVPDISIPTPSGSSIALRDIAFVADGLKAPQTFSRTSLNGAVTENALTLNIFKQTGGDVTKIAEDAKTKIAELQKSTIKDSNVVISFDRGELVQKDLHDLTKVGLETVALVMIVLFLTLGWRESVVAGLSIPLSFLIAFIGLDASGNTINFISLFSLILAVGILVDSGIVVVEAIHTRLGRFPKAEDAAILSIKEYAWPLIAGTMTTVAVFAPLFFISGTTGKFIASIPFTIIFVLIASIFVALGMVPLIAILSLQKNQSGFQTLQEDYTHRIQSWYKVFLGSLLDSRRKQNIFLSIMVLSFVGSLLLPVFGLVKVTFFPQGDVDFLYVEISKPQGTTLPVTDLEVRKIEEILYANKDIASFVTTIGESSSFANDGATRNTKLASITINLTKDRTKTSTEILEHIREELSPIHSSEISVKEQSNGPPVGAPITIRFLGVDRDALEMATAQAERLLATIPGTKDISTSLENNASEFVLTIDRDKATELGVNPSQVAQTLRSAVSGVVATTIKKQDKDIDVLVKLDLNSTFVNPEDTRIATVDDIKNIPILSQKGQILLGSVLSAEVDRSNAQISHEGRKRIETVKSGLESTMTAGEVRTAFLARASELTLDEGVTMEFGGENEETDQSFKDMFIALLAGMALILAILVLEFNSFRYSIYLLAIVPFSLIGVLAGLAITGKPLSFPSMLGFIALAGVIINHAIILLDAMLHTLQHDPNKPLREAVIEASTVRLRPIVLTTVTTVIGMVPLAGASALWGPLAFAIMFGLSFAMVLTLVLVPILFYRWPGKQAR